MAMWYLGKGRILALALAGGLVMAGCGGGKDPSVIELSLADEDDTSVEEGVPELQEGPGRDALPFSPQETLSDGEVDEILNELSLNGLSSLTLDKIVASGDSRFIAPLIELQRFFPFQQATLMGIVLHELTGADLGLDWAAWMQWSAENEPPLPPGYAAWKSGQLAIIDEDFQRFIYEDMPTTIRLDEVVWGGVLVDGIPALDNPRQVDPAEADYLLPDEFVFGVSINGDERAYPLRIMDWHEMFNDVVGGVPVSLAYCTLCGAGILYATTVDGEVYTFGSSGLLMRSNKLMYDRNTDSLWNQLTGEPVTGPLVGSGIKLEILPVTLTTWQDWLSDHPNTSVLDIDTGFGQPYEIGTAYRDYFASPATMFPVAGVSDDLATKDLVYALNVNGTPKAYPLDVLARERVTNDSLGGVDVVLVTGEVPAMLSPEPAGAAVRAYKRGEHAFSPAPDGTDNAVVDEDGETWAATEEGLVGPQGETLARVAGHVAYWFGWYAFYPDTLLYQG